MTRRQTGHRQVFCVLVALNDPHTRAGGGSGDAQGKPNGKQSPARPPHWVKETLHPVPGPRPWSSRKNAILALSKEIPGLSVIWDLKFQFWKENANRKERAKNINFEKPCGTLGASSRGCSRQVGRWRLESVLPRRPWLLTLWSWNPCICDIAFPRCPWALGDAVAIWFLEMSKNL